MKKKLYKPFYLFAVYMVLLSVIAFTPVKNIEIGYTPISEHLGLYTKEYITDTDSYKSSLRQILEGSATTIEHFHWGAYLTYIGIGAIVCTGVLIKIKISD